MTIENLIEKLVTALDRNSDLLEALTAQAAGKSAPASKATEKAAPAKATTKAAPATKAKAKKEEVSYDQLRNVMGNFMTAQDADEKKDRRDYVINEVLGKFGVETSKDIPADKRQEAIDILDAYEYNPASESEDDDEIL